MKDWMDSKKLDAEIVWLKSIPGAGETSTVAWQLTRSTLIRSAGKPVLASQVIAETRDRKKRALVFFFLLQVRRPEPKVVVCDVEEIFGSIDPL